MKNVLKSLVLIQVGILLASSAYAGKFVLTGAPGMEKSRIIEALRTMNLQIRPSLLPESWEETQGDIGAVPGRIQLLDKQLEQESTLNPNLDSYLDQGTVDVVAFIRRKQESMSEEFEKKALSNRYDLVFVVDPPPQSSGQASELVQSIEDQYYLANYKRGAIFHIPSIDEDGRALTPQERAHVLLGMVEYLNLAGRMINLFAGPSQSDPIQEFFGPVKWVRPTLLFDKTSKNYFGVHKNKQEDIDYPQFKEVLTRALGVPQSRMLQLVGDSTPFSIEGTTFARRFLRPRFEQANLIEYGYTGRKLPFQADVNAFVNEYVDENPARAKKVLANIVGHSHIALQKWKSQVSQHIQNFLVVYNESGVEEEPSYSSEGIKVTGYTTFGEDVIISDFLIQAKDGDSLVCLEGGAQSFLQVVNSLRQGLSVELVVNLRNSKDERIFSAARFLKGVYDASQGNRIPAPEEVKAIYEHYVSQLDRLFDPSRPEQLTKKALFDKAIRDFIEGGIYKRVKERCTFFDASEG